jgi:hypothetical protein
MKYWSINLTGRCDGDGAEEAEALILERVRRFAVELRQEFGPSTSTLMWNGEATGFVQL